MLQTELSKISNFTLIEILHDMNRGAKPIKQVREAAKIVNGIDCVVKAIMDRVKFNLLKNGGREKE